MTVCICFQIIIASIVMHHLNGYRYEVYVHGKGCNLMSPVSFEVIVTKAFVQFFWFLGLFMLNLFFFVVKNNDGSNRCL
jgi:hypothetical protein